MELLVNYLNKLRNNKVPANVWENEFRLQKKQKNFFSNVFLRFSFLFIFAFEQFTILLKDINFLHYSFPCLPLIA